MSKPNTTTAAATTALFPNVTVVQMHVPPRRVRAAEGATESTPVVRNQADDDKRDALNWLRNQYSYFDNNKQAAVGLSFPSPAQPKQYEYRARKMIGMARSFLELGAAQAELPKFPARLAVVLNTVAAEIVTAWEAILATHPNVQRVSAGYVNYSDIYTAYGVEFTPRGPKNEEGRYTQLDFNSLYLDCIEPGDEPNSTVQGSNPESAASLWFAKADKQMEINSGLQAALMAGEVMVSGLDGVPRSISGHDREKMIETLRSLHARWGALRGVMSKVRARANVQYTAQDTDSFRGWDDQPNRKGGKGKGKNNSRR